MEENALQYNTKVLVTYDLRMSDWSDKAGFGTRTLQSRFFGGCSDDGRNQTRLDVQTEFVDRFSAGECIYFIFSIWMCTEKMNF